MALITPTLVKNHPYASDVKIYKWASAGDGDTFGPVVLPTWNDLTFMMVGTTGGGTVALSGTLDPDGSVYANLDDTLGVEIALSDTTAAIAEVQENVYKVKPVLSGASSSAFDLFVMGK